MTALKMVLILRRPAQRGLEGRMAPIQGLMAVYRARSALSRACCSAVITPAGGVFAG
jgi:hypothetical protein